jgi:hypothetical protein
MRSELLRGAVTVTGALILVSLARGIAAVGVGTAVNDARQFLYVAGVMFWGYSQDWTTLASRARLLKFAVVSGWSLSGLAAFHIARYGLGGVSEFVTLSSGLQTARPLVAAQALILTLSGLIVLGAAMRQRSGRLTCTGLVFVVFLGLSQHRSVWLAALFAGVAAYVTVGSPARRLLTRWVLLAGVLLLVPLIVGPGGAVLGDLRSAVTDLGTYDARTFGWSSLIGRAWGEGPFTVFFGAPFGSGYERVEPGLIVVSYNPHNWYVSIFLRLGVVGLVGYIAIIGAAIIRGARERAGQSEWTAVLVGVSTYSWAYALDWHATVFLGVALAYCLRTAGSEERGPSQRRFAESAPRPRQ